MAEGVLLGQNFSVTRTDGVTVILTISPRKGYLERFRRIFCPEEKAGETPIETITVRPSSDPHY